MGFLWNYYLGSCSKKSSTSSNNKCLSDWFFKYFPHFPPTVNLIATNSCFEVIPYQSLIYPDWYIRLFIPFPSFQGEFQKHRRHYKQIRISDMTAWIATRNLAGLMNCTKYILNITSMSLAQSVTVVTTGRCLDAKKLDKTSVTWA